MRDAVIAAGGESLFNRTSLSIGVTQDDFPLYRGDAGLEQFLIDAMICQAVGIPTITVYFLGNNGRDGFVYKWGNAGLATFYETVVTFESISIPFSRRGSFFGNIRSAENPTGSVFG